MYSIFFQEIAIILADTHLPYFFLIIINLIVHFLRVILQFFVQDFQIINSFLKFFIHFQKIINFRSLFQPLFFFLEVFYYFPFINNFISQIIKFFNSSFIITFVKTNFLFMLITFLLEFKNHLTLFIIHNFLLL